MLKSIAPFIMSHLPFISGTLGTPPNITRQPIRGGTTFVQQTCRATRENQNRFPRVCYPSSSGVGGLREEK